MKFKLPEITKNSKEYLRKLALLGLKKRRDGNIEEEYIKRLEKELKIINDLDFQDYFLIVYEIVKFARKNNIRIGYGRGSAVSSLVAYSIGITSVDPIEYNLIFERFINENRTSFPDIDLDIQDDKKQQIINYILNKFGKEHVAQLSSKNKNKEITGIHPSGIIISKSKIKEIFKIHKESEIIQIDLDSKEVEEKNIPKFDLLSLRSLKIIDNIIKKIKNSYKLNFNDEKTYKLLGEGKTNGIFQLESDNAKKIINKVKPQNISELSDVIALNRPGTIKLLDDYLNKKKVFLYQEEIIKLIQNKLKLNPSEAENVRKIISKKDMQKIKELENIKNIDSEFLKELYKMTEYSFNKSHSIAYAMLSYEMAFLKSNFTNEYFEVLFSEIKNKNIIDKMIKEYEKEGYAFEKSTLSNFVLNVENNGHKILLPVNLFVSTTDEEMALIEEISKSENNNLELFKKSGFKKEKILEYINEGFICYDSKENLIKRLDVIFNKYFDYI